MAGWAMMAMEKERGGEVGAVRWGEVRLGEVR